MATSAAVPSTSTTLYAVPTKEWIIQPKPKPGRKPKKDTSAAITTDDASRRVQNRAAQRAFRERKQSQLAELQARVQSYEQGEIERNVALQNIAKRLKEENEALRRENTTLKAAIAKMEKDHELALTKDRKRWRDDSPSSTSSMASGRKRVRTGADSHGSITLSHVAAAFSSASPPSMASSPDSHESSEGPFSPISLENPNAPQVQAPLNNLINLSLPGKVDDFAGAQSILPAFSGCGFCSEGTTCMCREALHDPVSVASPPLKIEIFEQVNPPTVIRIGSPSPSSILDNLPAYKPAVPLKRRQADASSKPSTVIGTSRQEPTCSGDPNNCLACADDSFGKAFCAALGKSVAAQSTASTSSCGNCPCSPHNFGVDPAVVSLSNTPDPLSPMGTPPPICQDEETIPTNDAWRQLKAHPNVAFSDLALLADVVARRSKCTGPRVVISPAPGTVTPERIASPVGGSTEPQQILLTDPYCGPDRIRHSSSPPKLVPQEVLIKCGQERVREVQAAGVRDALRLLDAKFP
uniref:BZIP domain-containing protein n=1 Tax=Moniliophthora roreri TaxID=221103 RepID=A0A0W0G2L0_MONRR